MALMTVQDTDLTTRSYFMFTVLLWLNRQTLQLPDDPDLLDSTLSQQHTVALMKNLKQNYT